MAVENGYSFAVHALPTPSNTPHQTPSRRILQENSVQDSSSPAPFDADSSYFADRSQTKSIASLSDQRFSQTIDISLIGEIHTLKKELERKEIALDLAQNENQRQKAAIGDLEEAIDTLADELTQLRDEGRAQASRERSLERTNRQLQDASDSALNGLVSERDDALEREKELKKALEAERAKKRSLESDLDNAYKFQEDERQKFSMDARNMERKQHILETRVRTLVAELSNLSTINRHQANTYHHRHESIPESESVKDFDHATIRSNSHAGSRVSNRSIDDMHEEREGMGSRASKRSIMNGIGGAKANGLSLAEELEREESETEDDRDGLDSLSISSPDGIPEEVMTQTIRHPEDSKAQKSMGLPTDAQGQTGDEGSGQLSMGIIMDYMTPSVRSSVVQYEDAGVQVSLPFSPKLAKADLITPAEKSVQQTEPAANQSRKRVAVPSVSIEQPQLSKRASSGKPPTSSVSCQTDDLHAPFVLAADFPGESAPVSAVRAVKMTSSSTQTSYEATSGPGSAANRLSPADVPVIAIHPPSSRPPSSHNGVVLPPATRNAACQVIVQELQVTKSSSMQTEEIRVDKRPIKVIGKPRSAHATSKSRSPARNRTKPVENRQSGVDGALSKIPRRNLRSPPPVDEDTTSPPVPNINNAYPGENDDGPLTSWSSAGPRRPVRSGSILAGFDDTVDELPNKRDDDSDDGFLIGPPVRKTLSKVKDSWKLVPQLDEGVFDGPSASTWDPKGSKQNTPLHEEKENKSVAAKTTSKTFQGTKSANEAPQVTGHKPTDIRKAALVSSGTEAHVQRSKVPSELGAVQVPIAPPFPVPTRSSSRKIPISASDGAGSPTPHSTSFFTARHGQDSGRGSRKPKLLRKVQSAAAVTKSVHTPSGRPPPLPLKSGIANPAPAPQKRGPSPNQFILPYPEDTPESRGGSDMSDMTKLQGGGTSIESTNAQTSVVDAIAQTMVGEWMWKYVRKRSSFGVTETPQAEFDMGKNIESRALSGVRHKRWVWLAPYERAVIWSSKQPTSGPALLGKGGRKLIIQSVLDVKDDTPLPKGSGGATAFDRSILILTPERALKLTAVSEERHYIWVMALSFLSHSAQGMDDLAVPEPIPQPEHLRHRPPSREAGFVQRRAHVRDSIRIAKAKSRPSIGAHSVSAPPGGIDTTSAHRIGGVWDDLVERPSEDAAEPPQVPRMTADTRRRSNTGPQAPSGSFSGYHDNSVAMLSNSSFQGSERLRPRSRGSSGNSTRRSTLTQSQSIEPDVPPLPPPVRNDFFDAVGTVRMKAFVDLGENASNREPPSGKDKSENRGKKAGGRRGKEHKKDMSYWGVPDSPALAGPSRGREDPFRGF